MIPWSWNCRSQIIFDILLKQIHAGFNLWNQQVCFDEITCNNFKFETIQVTAELYGDESQVTDLWVGSENCAF